MTLPPAVERLLLDVVTIRDFERITAARVPVHGKVDVFAPEVVVWSSEGPAERTLQALLTRPGRRTSHPARHQGSSPIGWA